MKGKVAIRDKPWNSAEIGSPYVYMSKRDNAWRINTLKQRHLIGMDENLPKEIVFEGIVNNNNDHACIMVIPLAHSQWGEVLTKGLIDTSVSVRILNRPNSDFLMAIIENQFESKFQPGERIKMKKGWGLVSVAEQEKKTHLVKMYEEGIITMVSDDKLSYGVQTKNGYFNWIPEDYIEYKPPWWKR